MRLAVSIFIFVAPFLPIVSRNLFVHLHIRHVYDMIFDFQQIHSISLQEELNEMAENDRSIDNIFKPTPNGFLGKGGHGITYKGPIINYLD